MQQVLLNFILDESGSMFKVKDATVSQFKEYLNSLKNQPDAKYHLTLTKFSTTFRRVLTGKALSDIDDTILEDYTPDGNTALYDAIVDTVNGADNWLREESQSGRTYKVLCVILTDGAENSSKQYNRQQVFDLLKQKESTGFWTFVYLGANQDSWSVGQSIGVAGANTMNFVPDALGLQVSTQRLSRATASYASSSKPATQKFWDADAQADGDNA